MLSTAATAVAIIALVLAVLLGAACVVLLLALKSLRLRAEELAAEVELLEPAPAMAPDLEASFGTGDRRLLVVEILNPIDLALSRNRAAAVLAAMAPERLRKIVTEQAAREMVVEMEAQGVEVEVRVHAAR